MITMSVHINNKDKALFKSHEGRNWLSIEMGEGMYVPIFFPEKVSAEKIISVVDAINDAMNVCKPDEVAA